MKTQLPKSIAKAEERLEEVLRSNFTNFLHSTHTYREQVRVNRQYAFFAVFFVVAMIIAMFLIRNTYGTTVFMVMSAYLLLWLTILVLSGRKWLVNDRLLLQDMNLALVPILTNVLDVPVMYLRGNQYGEEAREAFDNAGILVHEGHEVVVRDLYRTYSEGEAFFWQIDVIHRSRIEKNDRLFKGVFMSAELTGFEGVTMLVTVDVADTSQEVPTVALTPKRSNLHEVAVVSEDADAQIYVVANNEVQARQVLSREVMQTLSALWRECKGPVRMAIRNGHIYLLMPKRSIIASTLSISTKRSVIRRNVVPVMKNFWYGLRLVESVSDTKS